MMHITWSNIEGVSYCFSRSSVKFQSHNIEEVPYCFRRLSCKFQGHKGQKTSILTQIERFRTVTPVWIHWWLWNDAQSLMQHRRGALLFSRSSVKFQGHTRPKIADFDLNWAFPDCNSCLNSPMHLKWCTKLGVAQKRCLSIFQGHPSNFKVTWAEKSTMWIQFEWDY